MAEGRQTPLMPRRRREGGREREREGEREKKRERRKKEREREKVTVRLTKPAALASATSMPHRIAPSMHYRSCPVHLTPGPIILSLPSTVGSSACFAQPACARDGQLPGGMQNALPAMV